MFNISIIRGIALMLLLLDANHLAYSQAATFENRYNHLNIDPFLPLAGTLQLQYERAISQKVSLSLSVGYKLSSGLLDVSEINFERFVTEEFDFTGIKIIPEFRWYFQKSNDGITGFYTGVYFRYQDSEGKIAGDYTSIEDETSRVLLEASLQSSSIGVEVGYKLKLSKGFFIDFIIAGPGMSFNTLELKEIRPVPQAFYDDLTDALKNLGIIDLLDPDFEIEGNQETNIQLPALRYGIKVGYSF